jgi:hypothetical protein
MQEASLSADEKQRRAVAAIRKNGFWFLDIPRTSSTSVKVELSRRFGPAYGKRNIIESEYATEQYLPDHMLASEVRDLVGQRVWDDIYSFTIVRNPWERALSLFHYRRKVNRIPADWSFAEYVERLVEAEQGTENFRFHASWRGAADFVLDVDDTVLVTHIIRFEEREVGLEQAAKRLHVPDLGRVHVQSASPPGRDYRSEYDDATRELIAQRFAKDALLFDYTF